MAELKVLVVFYSRTGNTRRVVNEIAAALPCEVEEIDDGRERRGLIGYFWAGFEAWFGRRVPLRESRLDPRRFDLVVVASPIWDMSVSSPVRAYLERHRAHLPEVAFVLTYGGLGAERVLAQMARLAGRTPRAVLTVRERELGAAAARAADFAAEVRRAMGLRAAA